MRQFSLSLSADKTVGKLDTAAVCLFKDGERERERWKEEEEG